jgi:hypothetical protein
LDWALCRAVWTGERSEAAATVRTRKQLDNARLIFDTVRELRQIQQHE